MAVFDDIKLGLEQAIEYEKGDLIATKPTIAVLPLESFTSAAINEIRVGAGRTQALFATSLGGSVKTVAAWESCRTHPEGAACRMLALTRNDPKFPVVSGIVAK